MKTGTNCRLYTGSSMAGTFQFGDTLFFQNSASSQIKPGDVLIYKDLGRTRDGAEIVHRVRKISAEGMLMQGDNNPYPDTRLVTATSMVGKVSHVERNGKRFPVQFSRFGLIRVQLRRSHYRLRRIIWELSRRQGQRLYGWLRNTGLVERLWRPAIVKVRFRSEKGPLIKYISRDCTVATHWINTGKFNCRKPYDLVMRRQRPLTNKCDKIR